MFLQTGCKRAGRVVKSGLSLLQAMPAAQITPDRSRMCLFFRFFFLSSSSHARSSNYSGQVPYVSFFRFFFPLFFKPCPQLKLLWTSPICVPYMSLCVSLCPYMQPLYVLICASHARSSNYSGQVPYVSLDVPLYVSLHVPLYVSLYVPLYVPLYVSLYVPLYVPVYECFYVPLYVRIRALICPYMCPYMCLYVPVFAFAHHPRRTNFLDRYRNIRVPCS